MLTKKFAFILGLLLLILTGLLVFSFKNISPLSSVLAAKTKAFNIVLVGDSMTAALGTNTPELKTYLKKYYPNTNFNIYNYSLGSTNLLTVKDRLEKGMTSPTGDTYPPILQLDFNLIIIESFGHNPLSQYPLAEGLKIRTQRLDDLITQIKSSHPSAKIAFLATIAPNRDRYAENTVNLMPEQRHQWADERTAYILNHIQYAKAHNILLIDVYSKSLKNGTGNIDYINTSDFIHPNPSGIYLIAQSIADFVYKNKLVK